MTKWLLNNSRVYTDGEGKSFNLNNKITAQTLHTTLTNYENKLKQMEKQINTDFIKDNGYTIEDISKWSWKKYE